MSQTYRVLIAGMGKRGQHHASAFSKNPRFEVVAISDPVPAQLEKVKALYPGARAGADVAALSKDVKPDIFCFCTPPHV
ncbi:MAG TPA: Gfo/Idh/MocA family oxidoreductase, partial [Planctomycetota bacterium]|nr:Gfo/Idh/MocA family oxidoreductase [Planctomycetota bacterium]